MSFTSTVKNETSKLDLLLAEKTSELSAIMNNVGVFNLEGNQIKIATENASVARRVFTLIKDLYGLSAKITVRNGYNFNKNFHYILEIRSKTNYIFKDLSLDTLDKIPNTYIYADEDLVRAYLRGLFMAIGSINDPKTSRYHLEFLVNNKRYAQFIVTLLNSFQLKSKYIKREAKYMIYIKEAEKISDFLRIIKATQALLYFEDIRIYRDHKNSTNRLNNCEQANVDKLIKTANDQVKNIEIIMNSGGFELLNDKVKEACVYRLKYQDASIFELSEIISVETGKKITKSGLHHRFKKLKDLAEKIEKNSK